MHSRKLKIDGEKVTIDFGHEGVLYKNSFVMYDKRTNSKWNHSTGLAMSGPLTGRELKTLPSRMIRWEQWKQQHPNTKVLIGQKRRGFMGSYTVERGGDVLGLSVGIGKVPTLYPFSKLSSEKVVNDKAGYQNIVVTYEPSSHQAQAFRRKVGDKTLTFETVGSSDESLRMTDRETGTVWDAVSGKALKGPLKGKQLQSTVGVTWRIDRWRDIYQKGNVYG